MFTEPILCIRCCKVYTHISPSAGQNSVATMSVDLTGGYRELKPQFYT